MPALSLVVLVAQLAVSSPGDSTPEVSRSGAPVPISRFALPPIPRDSVVEYSAAYYRRLDIHRYGSYAMLPLFAFQYWAGSQLLDKSSDASDVVKTGHAVAATGVAAIFTVNTVTGVWNLVEGWNDPNERTRKRVHALLMLAADAGFVATGLLANEAEGSASARNRHRNVAVGSIGLATAGWLTMLDLFR
jgi:hypothetical protein